MSNESLILTIRGKMLAITNKDLPMLINKLTLYVAASNVEKASAEIVEIKKQISEIEYLLKQSKMLGAKPYCPPHLEKDE